HRHQHAAHGRLRLHRGDAGGPGVQRRARAGPDDRKRRRQEAARPRGRGHRLDRQAVRSRASGRRRASRGGVRKKGRGAMSDDPFEAIKATFFQECEELLADLEGNLLTLESGSTDIEVINAVFRAVHSVKGAAGASALADVVRFAHVFETLMDELRSGRKPCDDATVKTLLRAADVLADHVAAARGAGAPVDPARSAGLVAELEALTYGGAAPVAAVEPEEDDFGFTPVAMALGAFAAPAGLPDLADLPPWPDLAALAPLSAPAPLPDLSAPAAAGGWKIVLRPHPRLYASANETGLLLRELARLGPTRVQLDDSGLPLLDALEPTDSHLIWTIE